jgi:hypothetical protein
MGGHMKPRSSRWRVFAGGGAWPDARGIRQPNEGGFARMGAGALFRQYLALTKISQKYSNPRKQSCQPGAPVALFRRVQSAPSNSTWTERDQVIRPKANNPQPRLPVTLTVRRA